MTTPDTPALTKDLPSVDRLLKAAPAAALTAAHGHTLIASEARALLGSLRVGVQAGTVGHRELAPDALQRALADRVDARLATRLKSVFNMSGTVIHTNLGRAVLAESALANVVRAGATPGTLELDLASGGRGDRDTVVEERLCAITGAQAATVVNNNAAAVLLTIAALARRREVIVSRGELVEIGGAFRMPDVMASAGARMVEVGTTNRTHPRDYRDAIGPRTALLMKVHTSNYAIQGFTASVDEATLAPIAHAADLPLATDLGSGALVDLGAYGLPQEPTPQRAIAAGADVVTFSGDKLLGGPQAGLIVGRREVIERIRRCPLKRALRVSKLPLAALEATLALYLQPERLARDLPTLRLLLRPRDAIRATCARLAPALSDTLGPEWSVEVIDAHSQIGSGSLPVERLASAALAVSPRTGRRSGRALDGLADALRALPRPVIGRISEGRLVLDARCVEDADEAAFVAQLAPLGAWRTPRSDTADPS